MSALAWIASAFSLMRLKSMAAFHASVACRGERERGETG